MTYAGAGKVSGLTLADLQSPSVVQFVGGIEGGVVHYGKSTGFFADRLTGNGPGYLSAAVLYENNVVEAASKPNLPFPLVAVYPKEGTFWSDHPAGVVDREWVDVDHRAAAELFLRYLLARPQQEDALRFGFRPADPAIALGAPVDVAHGVDPLEPKTTLETPSTEVIEGCLRMFQVVKKKSEVILVFDRSGSMNDNGKIAAARAGAEQLVSLLNDDDRFGLLPFNDQLTWISTGSSLSTARPQMVTQIRNLFADGGTALYDAVDAAHVQLTTHRDPTRISAIVVLTDGEDTNSRLKLDELLTRLKSTSEQTGVRIFTIAYGEDASKDVLKRISEATKATFAVGTTSNIISVFRDLSTYF